MDGSHAARLQGAQQFRGQVVHLLEKLCIVRVMAEVVIAGAVFIVIAKGDAGHIQVNAVRRPTAHFFHAIVVDGGIVFAGDFHTLTSYRSFQGFQGKAAQAVGFYDFFHLGAQFIVLPPFALQSQQHFAFGIHVQDVNDDRALLQKAVDAVHGLDKIVELVVYAHKDGPVAIPLEVAARPGQALFCAEQSGTSLRKVHDAPFAGL